MDFVQGGKAPAPLPHEPPSPVFPTLVTANWCPLSRAAGAFWIEAAGSARRRLRLLDAASREGVRFMAAMGVAGVPCMVLSPSLLIYGLDMSRSEAAAALTNIPETADAI